MGRRWERCCKQDTRMFIYAHSCQNYFGNQWHAKMKSFFGN
ncbi:unnamed protein product [Periconia digitata]|uniref:Uncharacterized protein n=1 Tax=Periconia digitata TaxID=1303443 RepID=A0A9W4XMV2_9PLEO|nr:unnamed protein product [Periconia digitata]